MKRIVIKFLAILSTCMFVAVPVQASAATDRIVATYSNGDLYAKDGPVNSPWHQITSGVNIGKLSVSGDRISVLDQGSTQKVVAMKEPSWNSPWNQTYWTDGSTPAAVDEQVSQLSDGTYRLAVLRADNSVVIKDGSWNTGWWSGTLALPVSNNLASLVLGGDRVGVIMDTGGFFVKQLTPGQFSHPNNGAWTLEAGNVADAKMTNTRIAYEDATTGNVYAKDGTIDASWYGNHAVIFDAMGHSAGYFLGGNRICVLKVTHEECKEGTLGAPSQMLWNTPASFDVNANRIVLRNSADGRVYLLEGSVNGTNSGWQQIGDGSITGLNLN